MLSVLGVGGSLAASTKVVKSKLEPDNNDNISFDDSGVPNKVIRQDNDFSSTVNDKGHKKSYIDDEGNLVPADPNGNITIQQHVRGSQPKKGESQYTSTSAVDENTTSAPKNYGDQLVEVDTKRLQQDIDSGKVTGVEIITPERVQSELQKKVDKAQKRYDANPSLSNDESLIRAKQDLENATRDNECLISGCIPSDYVNKE